jgi:hypothetical protein
LLRSEITKAQAGAAKPAVEGPPPRTEIAHDNVEATIVLTQRQDVSATRASAIGSAAPDTRDQGG